MTKEQFNKMIEGLHNPSRIKIAVNKDYDCLMSAENTNDTMGWFKANAEKLEENLMKMNMKWVYAIETCPDDKPFIYVLISPKMSLSISEKLVDRAVRTCPGGRNILFGEGSFSSFDIDKLDNTPTTLTELFFKYADSVFEVSEI